MEKQIKFILRKQAEVKLFKYQYIIIIATEEIFNLIQMENLPNLRMNKKRSQGNLFERFNGKTQNIKSDFQPLGPEMGSSKRMKKQSQGFVFSLSNFDEKSRQNKGTAMKVERIEAPFSEPLIKLEEDDQQLKRKMIYGRQSYKEKFSKEFPTAIEANNDLFSMVFLTKQKNTETVIADQSFLKKVKSSPQIQPIIEDHSFSIEDFQLGRKLGTGKFGSVYIARHKRSGFMCAIKKINKFDIDKKLIIQLIREIKIQNFLNHPNVVKMYTFFADKIYIYLTLQLCYSGQLYNFLKKKRKVTEDMTKNIVNQLCRALDYMHENQVIHRDIKPQNVIYHCGLVKICDFGWSISTNTMRGTFCGTPLYVSPQLLKRKRYNNKIDVWSVGILTYQLLFGCVPFEITTEQDFKKIVEDGIKFSKVTKVSNEAKDFILNCLEKDPRDRMTLPQLLEHPFLSRVENNVSMIEMY